MTVVTIVAVIFEAPFGITAGIQPRCAETRSSTVVLVSTTLLVSIPVFVLGFLAQFVFGFKLGLFPIAGVADG